MEESTQNQEVAVSSEVAGDVVKEAVAKPIPDVSAQAPGVAAGVAPVEPPPYTPNYKFTVHDKEYEVDEWMRGAITSKELEDKARELYEKAYGLDVIKPKLQKTREDFASLQEEYGGVSEGLNALRRHVKNRDFDKFFESVNIPKEWIYEWAVKQAKYQTLPPEEKHRYDKETELMRRSSDAEVELERLKHENYENAVRTKQHELSLVLQRPEVNEVMRDFDSREGKVGAFREQIALQALIQEQLTGKPCDAETAVNKVLALMGRLPGSHPAVSSSVSNANPNQVVKPVIPNIKSQGGNPVRKAPTSIEELRERARELRG